MRNCLRSGQITVLALLLGLLGLTVGLSAASRTLSDLKQVSFVDSGVRAYAAAEAGLQSGITDYIANNTLRCNAASPTAFSGTLPTGVKSLTYLICQAAQNYAYQAALARDDVFQVTIPTGNPSGITSVDVLWDDSNASMEIISLNSAYQLTRRVAKGPSASVPANTDSTHNAVAATNCTNATTCTISGMTACASAVSVGATPLLVRIKPIAGAGVSAVNVAICGRGASGPVALNTQTIVIEATATTDNGTTKRLQAVQTPPALPALFDNVIFSGGSLQKQ